MSITSVNAYTIPAPLHCFNLSDSRSVNSTPPTAGPDMFAIWYTVAPQVTAFTNCFLPTSVGSRALEAGPLNARPSPIPTSTA